MSHWRRIILVILVVFFVVVMFFNTTRAADFALDLDGTGDYVSLPTLNLGNVGSVFSLELFFNVDNITDNKTFLKDDWTGNNFGTIYMEASQLYWYQGIPLRATVDISGTTLNAWHHFAFVSDGSTVSFYLDGSLKESVSFSPNFNNNLSIGEGDDAPFWDGKVDELRFYNRVLTLGEIQSHSNRIFTSTSDDGLVGNWSFNEGTGSVSSDSSVNSNNAVIFGTASWVEGLVFTPYTPPPSLPPPPGSLGRAYRPEIEITAPQKSARFSKSVEVTYKATDQNDIEGLENLGLGEAPVSLFYSFEGGSWVLIAGSLSPEDSYDWNIGNIPEGEEYRVKARVRDKSGESNEAISEIFSIDKTPPLFNVAVTPALTKGESVKIIIESTEPLQGPPKIIVKQRGHAGVEVTLSGSGSLWEGRYEVIPGFDGTAKITTIEGRDIAGNIGNIIQSGGIFNVGVNPPPKPIIISPLDNDIVDVLSITVRGRIREDTKAVLVVNAKEIGEFSPDGEGNFAIPNVSISKTFRKGFNIIQIFSKDSAGNLSEPASLSVKFNNPPTVAIISPKAGDILKEKTVIEILGEDKNEDRLSFTIELSDDNGKTWQVFAKDARESSYLWDTREFPDGVYILRVTVSDGLVKDTVVSPEFTVQNFLPKISLTQKTISSNTGTVRVSGLAQSALDTKEGDIFNVDYSIDGGKSWVRSSGNFPGREVNFEFTIRDLNEGIYEILLRAQDRRDLLGKANITLIVDFGPPPAPTISSPKQGEAFGYREDLNTQKAGVQIRLLGKAEPDNTLVLTSGLLRFEGASDKSGNFDIEVTLRERGENTLRLYSIDLAGNRSVSEAKLSVVHNNPPDVRFLRPGSQDAIGGVYDVVFEIQDRDLDPIVQSSLSYRKAGDSGKIVLVDDLAKNLRDNVFSWDVSGIKEGAYELLLEASDGIFGNSITQEFYIDTTRPTITFEPLEKNTFAEAFTLVMNGSAEDNASGIAYVEYSIDLENWFKALITTGYRGKKAAYRVRHPFELQDGEYNLSLRATDAAGNVSEITDPQHIVIDTIPPRIGGYTVSYGDFILIPQGQSFELSQDTKVKFTISLERDAKSAFVGIGSQGTGLIKNGNLWESEITFSEIGDFDIRLSAEDFAGNRVTDKKIGAVTVEEGGHVLSDEGDAIEGAEVSVFVFSAQDQSWVSWQAESYGLENPVFTDKDGKYALFLPSDTYRISLQKDGFQRVRSSNFEVSDPRFVIFDFTLEKRKGVRGFLENILGVVKSWRSRIPFF